MCIRDRHGGDRRAGERQGEGPPKVAADIDAAAAIAAAKADPAVAAALEGKQLVKEIYVKGCLLYTSSCRTADT